MASQNALRDQNQVATLLVEGASTETLRLKGDVTTGALLVSLISGGGIVDTELPAAAALADATANPTTTSVGAEAMGFNGTTWDRVRSGQTANSATVTGFLNSLPMGKYNATPIVRTEGQFGNLQTNANGNLLVSNGQREAKVNQHTEIVSSAAETTILTAGAAGIFNDLTELMVTNQTGTAVNVTIKDATAGTTRMIIALSANGGAVIPFPHPLNQAAAANNWTATLSVATVTVDIFVQAIKNN